MRLSYVVLTVMLPLFVPGFAKAAFTLDCGKPKKQGVLTNTEIEHSNSFRIDFNIDGKVYLISTDSNGTSSRNEMWVDHVTKEIRVYMVDNVSVAHNSSGVFLNISGFSKPSEYRSECK